MVKNYAFLILVLFLRPMEMTSQEIKIFKVEDFDLMGKVKSCLVSTNYGKEEYDFNEEGLLTKSVTRYSDTDYDITYYKYSRGILLEKRLENYRDNSFDKNTSIANLYTIDSLLNLKITEKIISYNKEFLDQYEYYYKNDTLRRVVRSNNDGIDETRILYADVKGEQTKTYEMNNVIQQSIQTAIAKENDSIIERSVLTKKFLEGEPNSALEELFDSTNKLLSKTKFFYNTNSKQFIKEETLRYSYDASGMLLKTESSTSTGSEIKEYIFQFDVNGNWIKEIITPDNTYTTRKISYY